MLEYAQHALFGGIVFLSLALILEIFVATSHPRHPQPQSTAGKRRNAEADTGAQAAAKNTGSDAALTAGPGATHVTEESLETASPQTAGSAAAHARLRVGRSQLMTQEDEAVGARKENPSAVRGTRQPIRQLSGGSAQHSGAAWYGTAFIIVGCVLLTVYLVWRSLLTGHPPFANQHEYSVSFAWCLVLVYLFFLFRYQIRALSLLILPTALILLLYATQLELTIRPLVPALHDSLLLTFHVGFAIFSYGAAGVSFAAAVLYLLKPRLPWRIIPRQEVLDDIGYRAAALSFPLMTIMIILGALWANQAWGRYWGWDPKETSAFVVWLLYGAYLHARVVGKWRGKRSAWLLIVAFAAIIFTLLGNHFFGGLHSYA